MRRAEAEAVPTTLVFRYSRVRAVAGATVAVGVTTSLALAGRDGRFPPGPWIAGMLALLLLALRRFVTARFRPSNWLVRVVDGGLLVQFRSYLNHHFPQDDATVVSIPFAAIRSARVVREWITVPDLSEPRRTSTRRLRLIELSMAESTAELTTALDTELARPAPSEARWWGRSSTRYDHHPVRVPAPDVVRIEWAVVPRPERLLDVLRPYATIDSPLRTAESFTITERRPPGTEDARLRELVERGDVLTAVAVARAAYGLDVTSAKAYVDELRNVRAPLDRGSERGRR